MNKFLIKHVPLRRRSTVHLRIVKLVLVLALIALTTSATSIHIRSAAAQQTSGVRVNEVIPLGPNSRVQRKLEASAMNVHPLTFKVEQFARIVVEQKGVDAELIVKAPDGKVYRQVDNPNGLYGPETVSVLAHVAGVYSIEVIARVAVPAGSYELSVEGPRDVSAGDEMYVTAEETFAKAQQSRGVRNYDSAIEKYQEAVALWRKLDQKREQGYALTNAARSYRALGKPIQALEQFAAALVQLREANDTAGQALTLNEIGNVHRLFGRQQDAINSYEQALKLRLDIGDQYGQAQLYNNIALSYSNMGHQVQAAENLVKSSQLWREIQVRHEEMNTLVNAAKVNAEMGNLTVALSQAQEVLAFCDKELATNNSSLKLSAARLKPFALNDIALVYDTWGNTDEAQAKYKEALDLFEKNENLSGKVEVLDNLGLLHAFLGDGPQALNYFQAALVLREQIKEAKGKGVTLSNIGHAYLLFGNYPAALQQLELALPITRSVNDRRFEAYTLLRMGMAYAGSNDTAKALESYEKALAIHQDPEFADPRGEAITLDKMGQALARAGKLPAALKAFENAIQLWTDVGDDQGRALSLYGIARIERDRHNLANARGRIEEAISLVEKLRNRVTARQLQMIYFAGKQDLYTLGIDVRMQLYELTKSNPDLEAALSLSEQSRARNLIDLLAAAQVDPSTRFSAEQAEKNIRLQREINELAQTHLRLLNLKAKKDAEEILRTLKERIKEQDDLQASARRGNSPSSASQQAHPLTAREIQQLLDDNTIILEFSLGESRSHLWTISTGSIEYYSLPGGTEIENAARRLSQALTAPEPKQRHNESNTEFVERLRRKPDQYLESARDLSRMVLGKVWSRLGDKRIVIIADGQLQYIPFEVLPSPESSLSSAEAANVLLRNEIVYQPSASALALLRDVSRPNFSKTVAVFADPVFSLDDDRVRSPAKTEGGKNTAHRSRQKLNSSLRDIGDDDVTLSKLTYSLKEANAITAAAPRGSSMKKVGFDANRAAATDPLLRQFSIVHFATHGIVNDKQPELSGIVLSMVNKRGQDQDGYLTLHDLYYLDLPVRLVVVSACRTGVGKQVPGEGLIALTRGFMHAGAQAVVVSLWDVDDEATAEFMTRFYDHMLGRNKLSPAAALRQAKSDMQMHANEKWRAPFYWASFILQGDWK